MTEKCFDIGTIQSFLDGELSSDKMESVSRHISLCDDCATMLAEAEEESAMAFSALEQEFNTLVPTQRLWTKINDSIEQEKKSFWKPIFAFLFQPSTAALASLIFVFAIVIALLSMKPDTSNNYSAQVSNKDNSPKQVQSSLENQLPSQVQNPTNFPEEKKLQLAEFKSNKNEIRAVKTPFVREVKPIRNNQPTGNSENLIPVKSENLSGEESYIKTIATLTETVNSRKDEVLNSSARFAFEKDLAVTDDAIIKMKAEVKENPKNEAAKQILRASYQNKIDLLNSVAEKNDLMASLK